MNEFLKPFFTGNTNYRTVLGQMILEVLNKEIISTNNFRKFSSGSKIAIGLLLAFLIFISQRLTMT